MVVQTNSALVRAVNTFQRYPRGRFRKSRAAHVYARDGGASVGVNAAGMRAKEGPLLPSSQVIILIENGIPAVLTLNLARQILTEGLELSEAEFKKRSAAHLEEDRLSGPRPHILVG